MILDSNLIIDAARPEYTGLRRLIAAHSPAVSAVSIVEVLGYHKLKDFTGVPGLIASDPLVSGDPT